MADRLTVEQETDITALRRAHQDQLMQMAATITAAVQQTMPLPPGFALIVAVGTKESAAIVASGDAVAGTVTLDHLGKNAATLAGEIRRKKGN